MRRKIVLLILAVFIISAHAYAQDNQPMIGEEAPDFTLTDLNGDVYTLSKQLGSFVVIHFATSW